ncbi:BTB/POZ domain-containing protein [Apiospora arundinis]|uniref:BTB/POZ domain-containing protein n=1 Tax=Apiospora arundinis TaxID=335852 RepID=A0ABR2I240_9PEZI
MSLFSQEPPAPAAPTQMFSNNEAPIKLQVGECQFTTWKKTLTNESTFFASMFSGRWENVTLSDGAVFVDADGLVFKDVLSYLRFGNFPLFFDAVSKTFDYARYQRLLGAAKYFGIHRLAEWVRLRRYEDAFKVVREVSTFDIKKNSDTDLPDANAGEIHQYSGGWKIGWVYTCPNGIPGHFGLEGNCWDECGEEGTYKRVTHLKLSDVTTTYIWKPETCQGEKFP